MCGKQKLQLNRVFMQRKQVDIYLNEVLQGWEHNRHSGGDTVQGL